MKRAQPLFVALVGAVLMYTAACEAPRTRGVEAPSTKHGPAIAPPPPHETNVETGASKTLVVAGSEEPPPPPPPPPTVAAAAPARVPEPELANAVRDPRSIRTSPRPRPVLVNELQGLEALFMNTSARAPERPALLRRLAEGYVELESMAVHQKAELGAALEGAAPSAQRARTQEDVARLDKLIGAARLAAVRKYSTLIADFPTFCLKPNAAAPTKGEGCSDEALYFLGLEQEKGGQTDAARKSYLELIRSWPTSKYVPYAYLGFGELFFLEAQNDPMKWDYALQAYLEILKYPPPQNEAWGYANYQIANVQRAKEDNAKALAALKSAIESTIKFPPITTSAALAAAARRDIVLVFASVGAPKRAREFFRPLSGDPPGHSAGLTAMLDALVKKYQRDNKSDAAAEVCKSSPPKSEIPPGCQEPSGGPAQIAN